MKKIITLLLLGWLLTFSTTAQVVYNVSPSSSSADPGETIFVDVTVENFEDMIGFQFEMEWDDQILEFQEITTHDNIMCNIGGNQQICYSYPADFGPATITNFFATNYSDPSLLTPLPNTLADGEKLLTIEFLVVGQGGQTSPIDFRGAILAVDSDFNEFSVANGTVVANNGTFNVTGVACAGAGDVTFTASDESGDTGTSGSVKISVDNFDNVEGFGYTINWDPSIISFTSVGNLNLAGLTNPPPPGIGSFGMSQVSNGNLFVSWENSAGVTVCDGEVIFEIFYDIIGAGQTDTDIDFTGSIEVIKNSLLVPHQVNSGSVMVTGNGTGQNTGITFIAEDVSGEAGTQVCVPIKVANFDQVTSFQYDLSWDPTIITYSTILDGDGQPLSPIGSGNPLGLLNPSPPAVGNFGTSDISTGVLHVAWDNSAGVTLTDQTSIYQVCYDIIGSTGETSDINYGGTIEVADVNGIADFTGVPGSVEVIEVFDDGLNVEWDCCQKASPGENICVDVRVVDGFDQIVTAQFGMLWDNSILTYESIAFGNGNPLGLTEGNNIVYEQNADAVKLVWFDNSLQGVSLAPGTSLFQVCFDVTGSVGSNGDLDFGPLPNAIPALLVEISIPGGETIDFLGNSCNVAIDNILPITISETITNPTCVGVTDGAIDITVSGGVEEYSYVWSTTATSQDITGLAAGSYTVTVTDCKGVTAEETFTITDPAPVTGTANITQVSGAGNSDGAIDLTPSGGTPTYTFLWSNASINEDINGLQVGTYTVTITDVNGCTGVESFEVPNACNPITITVNTVGEVCAGQSNGSATASGSGGVGNHTYTWSNGLPPGPMVSGLAPGPYSVTATDDNGCTGTTSFSIENGASLLVNIVSATNLNCFGNNSGSIEISGFGGTGPYSAVWQPGNMTGLTISNLAAGTYTPVITDTSTGCTAAGNPITLTQPTDISMSGTVTDASCNGGSDGSISLNVTGGTGNPNNYLISWSNGAFGQNINNLPAGTYTPAVTDENGCLKIGASITVGEPAAISAIPTINNASCFGEEDGSISLNISGGTTPYASIAWSNGATGTSISGLAAGGYSVTIEDANGCTFSDSYQISQPAAFGLSFVVTNESSAGNDGAIDLTVSPTGGYTYLWSNGATTQDITGLNASIYTVTVTDPVSGCTAVGSDAVTNTLSIQTEIVTNVTCHDGDDGSIELTVFGGTPAYSYEWINSNGTFTTTQDVFGLSAGTYTVEITDQATPTPAVITKTYVITEPSPITITNVVIIDELIDCDGSINITVAGGVGPYDYLWSNGEISEDIVGLCNDNYKVTITDANGCIFISDDYTIEPSAPQIGNNSIVDDVSCFGDEDGKICVNIIGGTPSFNVNLNNGGSTITSSNGSATTVCFNGLSPGNYEVEVTDANGFVVTSTNYIVDEPAPISIANVIIDHQSPNICNGKIDITAVGGTGNLTYLWSNGASNPDPANLCMGMYNVTITDENGCIFVSPEYVVSKLTEIDTDITAVDCHGDSTGAISIDVSGGFPDFYFVWIYNGVTIAEGINVNSITNRPAGNHQVIITDGMGVEIHNAINLIGEPANPVSILSSSFIQPTPGDCAGGEIEVEAGGGVGGFTFSWVDQNGNLINDVQVGNISTISGLTGGTYFLTVTDANDCSYTAFDAELDECQISLNLQLAASQLMVSCIGETDGTISVVGDGGDNPYTYEWGSGINISETGIDGSTIENLAPGTYEITATDANGITVVETYIVTEPAPIQITIDVSPGRAEAIVIGGTPPYTYQWDQIITTDPFIEGLQGGIQHAFMVTDSNDCVSEIQYFDLDYDTGCYEARTVISPNNDGLNDNFYVNCLEQTTVKVTIFNRWGQEVYQNNDYDNSFTGVGRRNRVLPQGGYFYVLEYEDANGVTQTSRGSLSIVR